MGASLILVAEPRHSPQPLIHKKSNYYNLIGWRAPTPPYFPQVRHCRLPSLLPTDHPSCKIQQVNLSPSERGHEFCISEEISTLLRGRKAEGTVHPNPTPGKLYAIFEIVAELVPNSLHVVLTLPPVGPHCRDLRPLIRLSLDCLWLQIYYRL